MYQILVLILLITCSTGSLAVTASPAQNKGYKAILLQALAQNQAQYDQIVYGLVQVKQTLHPEFQAHVQLQQISDIKDALAFIQQSSKPFHQQQKTLKTSLTRYKNKLRLLEMLAQGNLAALTAALQAQLKFANDPASIHHDLGRLYLLQFDYLPAFDHARKAVRLMPGNTRYHQSAQGIAKRFISPLYFSEVYIGELSNAHSYQEVELICALFDHIGAYWSSLGRYKEAQAYFTRAMNLKIKTFGIKSPLYASSLLDMGKTFIKQKNISSAKIYAEKALQITRNKHFPDRQWLAQQVEKLYRSVTKEADHATKIIDRPAL